MQPWLMWLIAGLVLLIVELFSMTFFLMWVAAGALLTALLAAFVKEPTWLHWGVFAVTSLIMLIASRPLARSLHGRVVVPSNVDSLVGQTAIVLETIDSAANSGRVRVGSDEWRARAVERIAQGARVQIESIHGTTLHVIALPETTGENAD